MDDSYKNQFLKIAHRGASAYEPENTLRSFSKAIKMKADMIEFDIRLSVDERLVVIHDTKVNRTTNGKGYVKEKTLKELKELNAGKGEKIPLLEEVIELAKTKTRFVIELKEYGTEEMVIKLIKENNITDDAFVISFKKRLIKNIKSLEPRIKTGLIILYTFNPLKIINECNADALAPYHLLVSRQLIKRVKNSGKYLFPWTVNNGREANKLKVMGASGIVTNKPDLC